MWPWTPLDFGLNVHFDINQEYPGGLAWNWLVTAILRTFFIFEQCVHITVKWAYCEVLTKRFMGFFHDAQVFDG